MKKNKHLLNIVNDLISASFIDGKVIDSSVKRSVKLLKSLPVSQAIESLSEYLKSFKRIEKEHAMYIDTAISLSAAQVNKLKKSLLKMQNRNQPKITKVSVQVKPKILGGFVVKIGDNIWDESILGKAYALKGALTG